MDLFYAVDPKRVFQFFPQAKDAFHKFLQKDPLQNVEYSVQRLDELEVGEPLDAIFMVMYYHDTLWTGENKVEMNQRIFNALKPGGRFLIIDHHALDGAGIEVNKTLHRMDHASVVPEITQAGFKLILDSNLLANPVDPRNVSVFDKAWRGKTDRFIYVFERPKG